MFSEVAEIARVAQRLGQFQQLLKTRAILILNFTRPHAITYTNKYFFFAEFIIAFFRPTSWVILKQLDPSPSRATDQ